MTDLYSYRLELCRQVIAMNSQIIGGLGMTLNFEIENTKETVWLIAFRYSGILPRNECLFPSFPPGTTIISACKRSYEISTGHNFYQLTVNLSYNFICRNCGKHTEFVNGGGADINRIMRHALSMTNFSTIMKNMSRIKELRGLFRIRLRFYIDVDLEFNICRFSKSCSKNLTC
ncbi:hypothetical protein HZS_3946 [Henneguya salminicola]|nr:hypothetical protein HZS_3946 [Henneguya salminicola]